MSLLSSLKLLLPALFPSWRFFDVIGPSPRVELCLLEDPEDEGDDWQECRPRPATRSVADILKAFFWNARWNETLHLGNCTERFVQGEEEYSAEEIRRRLQADLAGPGRDKPVPPFFRFRLVFVSPYEGTFRRDVAFVSPPYPTDGAGDR